MAKKKVISVSQLEAQKRYDDVNTKSFCMKLNYKTDADLIEKLLSVDSVQGYIKELIRKDIENELD